MDIHLSHSGNRLNEKLLAKFFEVETTHWWWTGRKKIVSELLSYYLNGKTNVILDGGCGTGAGIIYLGAFGTIYGVDLSPVAIQFCKKRGLKNVMIGNILKLPFENNKFDLVCLMDVIEHIKEDKAAIKEAYRVLKPGGYLLMTMPALPFIYSNHDKKQGHFKRYTKRTLFNLFNNTAFKEIKISYFNIFLSPPIIFIRLISRLGGPFTKLADYDSKLNYDIIKHKNINFLLTSILSSETIILSKYNIPFGISFLTLHKK